MRVFAIAALLSLPSLSWPANKLSFDDRVELTRGLMAEYGDRKSVV